MLTTMASPLVYLENSVVTGVLANRQQRAQRQALAEILRAHRKGSRRLVVSAITSQEIDRAPAKHRAKLTRSYKRFSSLPLAPAY